MKPLRALLTIGGCGLVLVGAAGADGTELRGSVGPGFVISLQDASGASVTKLDPGTFNLVVDDKSSDHNFRLQGPGVNVATDVAGTGTKTFSITLTNGRYTFVCDPHAGSMVGSFTVGAVTDTTPAPTPKPTPSAKTRLVLTVTGKSVTLTTPAGKPVKATVAGPASITVRDRSTARGGTLRGAGVSKSTTASFVGNVTWNVTLSAGTLVFGGKPALAGGRVTVS